MSLREVCAVRPLVPIFYLSIFSCVGEIKTTKGQTSHKPYLKLSHKQALPMASIDPTQPIALDLSTTPVLGEPSMSPVLEPASKQTIKTSSKLSSKLLSPLDKFHSRYIKPIAKNIVKLVSMKERTQQAQGKYRKGLFAHHNIKKEENKQGVATMPNISQGHLQANCSGRKAEKRASKGASKFVGDAMKVANEITVDTKRATRRLSKAFLGLGNEAQKAQTSVAGANEAEAKIETGTESGTGNRVDAERRHQSISRPGETGCSSWVAPTEW